MIVVDTNIITYLFIDGENTNKTEVAFNKDPVWVAPLLWRSEFRNVLSFFIRNQSLSLDKANEIINEAEGLMADNEYAITSLDVLSLTASSGCSAYDCEFVALAKDLGIPLITSDKKIITTFPQHVISLDNYAHK